MTTPSLENLPNDVLVSRLLQAPSLLPDPVKLGDVWFITQSQHRSSPSGYDLMVAAMLKFAAGREGTATDTDAAIAVRHTAHIYRTIIQRIIDIASTDGFDVIDEMTGDMPKNCTSAECVLTTYMYFRSETHPHHEVRVYGTNFPQRIADALVTMSTDNTLGGDDKIHVKLAPHANMIINILLQPPRPALGSVSRFFRSILPLNNARRTSAAPPRSFVFPPGALPIRLQEWRW